MRGGGLSFYKVEPNPKNAWVDSPAPANGIAHAMRPRCCASSAAISSVASDEAAEHGRAMPVKRHASKILNEYGEAQSALIGKAVVLTDGKAGTVENVWLGELHGLRISIKGHDGRWPVSTIKLVES